MDLAERHVVITGAAGGLGPAVVEAMLAAGAICHLPVRSDGDRLPRHARILAVEGVDLTDEAAVTSFYARCPPLWASIHLAGGFNAALLGDTPLADLRAQLDSTSRRRSSAAARRCATCARRRWAAAWSTSARATAADPAGGSVAYITSKAAVSALVRALADELADDRILVNGDPARHHRHARQPRRDALRGSRQVDQAGRDRGADRLAGVTRADRRVGRAASRSAGPESPAACCTSAAPSQFAVSVTLSMQTVLLPAFENVKARPIAGLLFAMKLCVKVCGLLLTPFMPVKIVSYGAVAMPTLMFTVPDPDA